MMFMIPMPPTSSEIEAMPPSRRVSSPLTELTVPSSWAWSAMVKSSVPPRGDAVTLLEQVRAPTPGRRSIWSADATLMPIERTLSPATK